MPNRIFSRPHIVLVLAFACGGVLAGCSSQRAESVRSAVPEGSPVTEYRIGAHFGEQRGHHRHQGIDLLAPSGVPVTVTADGTVVAAGRSGSAYGRLVRVDHGNGYETRYAHLARVTVRVGEHLHRGKKIGTVGRSGNATTAHLHYELRVNGQPVDPAPSLRR